MKIVLYGSCLAVLMVSGYGARISHYKTKLHRNYNVAGDTSDTNSKFSKILVYGHGFGAAQANPTGNGCHAGDCRVGEKHLACDTYAGGCANAKFGMCKAAGAASQWGFLDNPEPLTNGNPAPDFGHKIARLLEQYGAALVDVVWDRAGLASALGQSSADKYGVVIGASKGIDDLVWELNAMNYQGSVLLINGLLMLRSAITAPVAAVILTHGEVDAYIHGGPLALQPPTFVGSANTFIYINKKDGHNPRSLTFPQYWKDWHGSSGCSVDLTSINVMGTNSASRKPLKYQVFGGSHREDGRECYLNTLTGVGIESARLGHFGGPAWVHAVQHFISDNSTIFYSSAAMSSIGRR